MTTLESNVRSDRSRTTELALRVALTTMKERCVSLQRRLIILEEKQEMHDQCNGQNKTSPKPNGHNGGAAENLQLRLQVADLQRQKAQLTEHVTMVSSENRKLWSRLSQIAKEQCKIGSINSNENKLINTFEVDVTSPIDVNNVASGKNGNGGANQNLIRSKTFTQHSPNPHLRHKLITTELNTDMKDISMEEINLGGYNEVDDDDLNDDGVGGGEEFADAAEAELAFAYLDVNETSSDILNESGFNCETKKIIDGLQEMRREAMKQNKNLNAAFIALKSKKYLQPCMECTQKCKKPETADKSLETDDSLNEIPSQTTHNQNKEWNCNNSTTTINNNSSTTMTNTTHINIIQEKIEADDRDKICPMCGKIFNSLITFQQFREHVEFHFLDDVNSIEESVEHNFELLQTVGDF